jgi:hypothetical protein
MPDQDELIYLLAVSPPGRGNIDRNGDTWFHEHERRMIHLSTVTPGKGAEGRFACWCPVPLRYQARDGNPAALVDWFRGGGSRMTSNHVSGIRMLSPLR